MQVNLANIPPQYTDLLSKNLPPRLASSQVEALNTISKMPWIAYEDSLPFKMIKGIKFHYWTQSDGTKIPTIAFHSVGARGNQYVEGFYNKKYWQGNPITGDLSTFDPSPTWLDKFAIAGNMIAFSAYFAAVGSSISGALAAGDSAALASGGEISLATSDAMFTGANAVKLGQATFGNEESGQIIKLINLGNGAITGIENSATDVVAPTPEVVKVDELDFGDYDPVDYSSGESWAAFSDAQNVDFGFDDQSAPDFSATTEDESMVTVPEDDNYSHEGVNFNATAESNVSDYGSSSQGNPTYEPDDASKIGVGPSAAIAAAAAVKKTASPTQTLNPSGGGAKYSQTASGLATLLAPAAQQSQGSAPSLNALTGLIQQVESVLPKTYAGQLGVNKTSPSAGLTNNHLLLIGAGLIIVALAIHYKG